MPTAWTLDSARASCLHQRDRHEQVSIGALRQARRERLAGEKLHEQERMAFEEPSIDHLHDSRIVGHGRRARVVEEALYLAVILRPLSVQELHRDALAHLHLARHEDDAESASRQLLLEDVVPDLRANPHARRLSERRTRHSSHPTAWGATGCDVAAKSNSTNNYMI